VAKDAPPRVSIFYRAVEERFFVYIGANKPRRRPTYHVDNDGAHLYQMILIHIAVEEISMGRYFPISFSMGRFFVISMEVIVVC